MGRGAYTDEQSTSFERRQKVQEVRLSQVVHDSKIKKAGSSRASILIDDEVSISENLGTYMENAAHTDEQSASFDRRQRVQQVRTSQEVHDSETIYASSSHASILINNEVNIPENRRTFLARSIVSFDDFLRKLSLIVLYFGLYLLVVFGGLILANPIKSVLVNPIKSGTKMSLPTSPPPKPFFSEALLAAAAAGSWNRTSRLLNEGAKPSIRDSNLRTPLHLAASNGNTEVIALLLEQKDIG